MRLTGNILIVMFLIEENILNSQDLLGFAEHINKRLKETSIIADTNYYSQEFYDMIQAKQKIRVLVYGPLEQLLNRDHMRAIKFKRSREKNKRARKFVISGYDSFFGFQNKFEIPFLENGNQLHTCYQYDLCVSGSEEDIEKVITQIKTFLKND